MDDFWWVRTAIVSFSCVLSLGTLVAAIIAVNRITTIHELINSRLTQLLKASGDLRYLEGRDAQRDGKSEHHE